MKLLILSLSIVSFTLTPLIGFSAEVEPESTVADTPAPVLKSLPVSSVKTDCQVALENYRPIGYVSGALVNRFSNQTPLLFTDLYFRSLGKALFRHGFEQIANGKGVFYEDTSEGARTRALNIAGGKSASNVQLQGTIATEIWNNLVEAFQLREGLDSEKIVLAAKKAYYDNVDEFMATHDFLMANITYKREVIELIRLSLPFGIRMAIGGVKRSDKRAIFYTGLATLVGGAGNYALVSIYAMLSTLNPGALPLLVTAAVAPLAGGSTYIFTAPKSRLRKLNLWLMNWANRRALKKQGLISEDGESTALIHEVFRDLSDLQNEVNVADIKAVVPVLPKSANLDDVESAMMRYADTLSNQLTSVTAFQEAVTTELQKHTRALGEPISSIARILQLKDGQTAYAIPDNARVAIDKYRTQVLQAYDKVAEVEGELQALAEQYDTHLQVLTGFLHQNSGTLDNRAKLAIERKLEELRTAKVSTETIYNVARTQKDTLGQDKAALDGTLTTIAAVQANKALSTSQAGELKNAMMDLAGRMDQAQADVIQDKDQLPTTEAKK